MNGSKQAAKGMSADAFGDLMAGMEDVRAFERGKRRGFVVHSGQDIKAIRAKTKLTQPKFAEAFTSTSRRCAIGNRAAASPSGRRRCCWSSSTASRRRCSGFWRDNSA
jgi:DNA-binding transcriptional regulator YiaG